MNIAKKLRHIGVLLMSGLYALAMAAQAATPNPPVLLSIDGQLVETPSGAAGTHKFTGLPLTSDGWTDLHSMIMTSGKYDSARIVYVSSSQGSDQTAKVYSKTSTEIGGQPLNPTGQVMPYASLSTAYAQLRNGYPDIMLLKRGDTWSEKLSVGKAGKGLTERMIVGAYGPESTVRPKVATIASTAAASYVILTSADNTAVADITYDGSYLLIEDYRWHGDGTNYNTISAALLEKGYSGIRRSVFNQIGIYSGWNSSDGSTSFVDENTFYKVGNTTGDFRHNVYLQYMDRNLNSMKNQSFESPGVGYRQRGGGLVEQNLIVKDNPSQSLTSIEVGETARTATATLRNNLVMHSQQSVEAVNLINSSIEGNIFTAQRSSWPVVSLSRANGYDFGNVTISGNIFWNMLASSFSGNNFSGPISITGNTFRRTSGELVSLSSTYVTYSDNHYYSGSALTAWFGGGLTSAVMSLTGTLTALSYPDPNRDMLTYMKSLGASPSSTDEAISWYSVGVPGQSSLAGSINNRRGAWDTRFTATGVINYVRAGFGLAALSW